MKIQNANHECKDIENEKKQQQHTNINIKSQIKKAHSSASTRCLV